MFKIPQKRGTGMWVFLKLLQKRMAEQGLDNDTREYKTKTQHAKWVSKKQRASAPLTVILHGMPTLTQLFLNTLMQKKVLKSVIPRQCG